MRVAWALALHVGVPALIAWLPTTTGMRLRDFADFYPEQALVMAICDVLLVAGGAMKMASLGRARGGQGGAAFGGGTCRRARALLVAEGDAAGASVGTH